MAIDTAQKRAAMVELGGFTTAVYVPSAIDSKLERAQIAFAFDPADGGGGGGGPVTLLVRPNYD